MKGFLGGFSIHPHPVLIGTPVSRSIVPLKRENPKEGIYIRKYLNLALCGPFCSVTAKKKSVRDATDKGQKEPNLCQKYAVSKVSACCSPNSAKVQ